MDMAQSQIVNITKLKIRKIDGMVCGIIPVLRQLSVQHDDIDHVRICFQACQSIPDITSRKLQAMDPDILIQRVGLPGSAKQVKIHGDIL